MERTFVNPEMVPHPSHDPSSALADTVMPAELMMRTCVTPVHDAPSNAFAHVPTVSVEYGGMVMRQSTDFWP